MLGSVSPLVLGAKLKHISILTNPGLVIHESTMLIKDRRLIAIVALLNVESGSRVKVLAQKQTIDILEMKAKFVSS